MSAVIEKDFRVGAPKFSYESGTDTVFGAIFDEVQIIKDASNPNLGDRSEGRLVQFLGRTLREYQILSHEGKVFICALLVLYTQANLKDLGGLVPER